MSREDQHFRLRLPADLREKVEAAAAESRRSLTAEILARLEQTFDIKSKDKTSSLIVTPGNHDLVVKSPYYADHYFLLLGPSVADYLLEKDEYIRFVRSYADILLQLDYKLRDHRLEAQILAGDYMIQRRKPFPINIEKELYVAARRYLHANGTADDDVEKGASPMSQAGTGFILREANSEDQQPELAPPDPRRSSLLRRLAEAGRAEAAQGDQSTTPSTPTSEPHGAGEFHSARKVRRRMDL